MSALVFRFSSLNFNHEPKVASAIIRSMLTDTYFLSYLYEIRTAILGKYNKMAALRFPF